MPGNPQSDSWSQMTAGVLLEAKACPAWESVWVWRGLGAGGGKAVWPKLLRFDSWLSNSLNILLRAPLTPGFLYLRPSFFVLCMK